MRESIIWQANNDDSTRDVRERKFGLKKIQSEDGIVRALGGIRPSVRVQVVGIQCHWKEMP